MQSFARALPFVLALIVMCGGEGTGGGKGPVNGGGDPPDTRFRSSLYPADWTPAFRDGAGRFLHDFSFAGYRNGEAPLPDLPDATVFDAVADHGADPSGATDSTAAIQAAIDAAEAAGGAVVFLSAGLYRVDGVLAVEAPGVVLRGEGAERSRLAFTKSEGMSSRSHLTFRGRTSVTAELSLAADARSGEADVLVADASSLSPGDDVDLGFTITAAFVDEHGMTGVWTVFLDTWQPFFRRTVVAVDTVATPHRVILDVPLRYAAKVRDGASLRVVRGLLSEVGVERLGVGNAVADVEARARNQVHAVEFSGVKDGWIRDVASFAPPLAPAADPAPHLASGGIIVRDAKRVTVAGCRMALAQHRGGGGNGYLFEVRQSSEILFRDCTGQRGRHNFIQNWGFGVTGCVFLRCDSLDGRALNEAFGFTMEIVGASEYHHSLATANLVDGGRTTDGWSAVNRGRESSGAGHSATECVFWGVTGTGFIRSAQFGHGYVIGTGPGIRVLATGGDFVEGDGRAADLDPPSLYEDQLARRKRGKR